MRIRVRHKQMDAARWVEILVLIRAMLSVLSGATMIWISFGRGVATETALIGWCNVACGLWMIATGIGVMSRIRWTMLDDGTWLRGWPLHVRTGRQQEGMGARQRVKDEEVKGQAQTRQKEEEAKQRLELTAQLEAKAAEEREAQRSMAETEARQSAAEEEVRRAEAEQKLAMLRQTQASLEEEVRQAEREVQGLLGTPIPAVDDDSFNLQLQPCVICMELPPVMLVAPCGHRCLCEKDAAAVMQMPKSERECPICRSPIRNMQRVFD